MEQQQLARCIQQLDREATFSYTTECESFAMIPQVGQDTDGGAGLVIGLVMTVTIVVIVALLN